MIPPPLHTARAFRPLAVDLRDPLRAFERLRGGGHAWLLDRAAIDARAEGWGATFLGAAPYAVVSVRGRSLELEVVRAADPRFAVGRHRFEIDPGDDALSLLHRILPAAPPDPAPGFAFCGGALGYLGYELAEQLDAHRLHGRDDLGLPDAVWLLVDRVLVLDPSRGCAFVSGLGIGTTDTEARQRAEAAVRVLARAASLCEKETPPRARPVTHHRGAATREAGRIDAARHAKAVDEVKQQIHAGNVYQACLTARACQPFDGDPWRLYQALRRVDPAPFACFLELDAVGLTLVGGSPERFLRVDRAGIVESRPIKGTARRGRDPAEDAARREALRRSEKDRAENLMIVDLVRNDLGRVCRVGSVHVPELFAVEAYAEVFQLVSVVRGTLAEGRDAFDAVRAAFPPGSMTGAPKIAAMALLDRLEPVRRTVYAGAVGYFDVYGGADLSVVIRTALVKDGTAWLHAGGGIVADSDPAAEHREAQDKLRPLLRALLAVRGGGDAAAICSASVAPDPNDRAG